MDYESIIRRQAKVPEGQKRCKICDRIRPTSFFAAQGRYTKPYCKSCYKAYQVWYRRIDRDEARKLTVEEFKVDILPLLVREGQAPWATEEQVVAQDPDEDLPYEEMIARMIATAPINQATPYDS